MNLNQFEINHLVNITRSIKIQCSMNSIVVLIKETIIYLLALSLNLGSTISNLHTI